MDDVLGDIFDCIASTTHKTLLITTKRWFKPAKIAKKSNVIMTLFNMYPSRKWDWDMISGLDIPIDFILNHQDKGWNWNKISSYVTMDIILAYPNIDWNWREVSFNPNITIDIIRTYPDMNWNWVTVSRNPNITVDIILSYPNLPWDWGVITCNSNITMNDILSYPDKGWNKKFIPCNPNITLDVIDDSHDSYIFTDWFHISFCANAIEDIMQKYPNKIWPGQVSINPNFKIDMIITYSSKRWNWYAISKNPNVTAEIILAHPELPWCWGNILYNPNIELDFILLHLDRIF